MEYIFQNILNLSFMGSVAVLLIAVLKLALGKKLSAKWHYGIWALLIIRLAVPVSLPSPYSIFTFINHGRAAAGVSITKEVNTPKAFQVPAAHETISKTVIKTKSNNNAALYYSQSKDTNLNKESNSPLNVFNGSSGILKLASYVWFGVFIILLLFAVISYIRISLEIQSFRTEDDDELKVKEILLKCQNKLNTKNAAKIIFTNKYDTPFVFGIIRPRIVMPKKIISELELSEKEYILLHEMMHIKWKDNIISMLSLFLQIIHWFNPIIILGFRKAKNDCELACDARVLEKLDINQHKGYAETLLQIASRQNKFSFAYSGVAFGESNIKGRVLGIMNFKKKSAGTTFLAIVIAISAAGLVNTNATESSNIPKAKTVSVQPATANKAAATKPAPKNNDYIIPYSNQRLLENQDLSFLDGKQLFYARNEIYARHGYVFTNKDCINYFNNEAWYHKNYKFNDNILSSIEKSNAAFLKKAEEDYAKKPVWEKFRFGGYDTVNISGTSLTTQNVPIVKNKQAVKFALKSNVNYNEEITDGNKYAISVNVPNPKEDSEGKYTLNIDGKSVQGDCMIRNEVSFDVVKLNQKDNFKYIIVRCGDFDDWFRLDVYSFDGSSIKKAGQIEGINYVNVNYDGNGIMEVGTIGRVLQSHICPLYYNITLNKIQNINLKYTPYALYSDGKMKTNKLMLKTNLTLYKDINSNQVAAKLQPGDTVYQISNYGNNYICLKTSKGVAGWFHLSFVNSKDYQGRVDGTNKIPDDVFAGIVQFD